MKKFSAHKGLLSVFLAVFILGYSVAAQAQATPVVAATTVTGTTAIPCPPSGGTVPCDATGTAKKIRKYLVDGLKDALEDSAKELENKLSDLTNGMVKDMLKRLNNTEKDIISWWSTMWYYNLQPSLQHMTIQLNVSTANQTKVVERTIDAHTQEEVKQENQGADKESHQDSRPNEKACAPATVVGGINKVTTTSKAVRRALEKKSQGRGLNKRGTKGANSAIEAEAVRYEEYKQTFCDPDGNGGRNDCPPHDPGDEKFINADTKPTEFIYGQSTIPVDPESDPEGKMRLTIETQVDNLIGVPSADPISEGALQSPTGQETFLNRRSYLARHAAARSVPQLIIGWRMPGSKMGEWVEGLREGAGIPLEEISKNPSYKEIVQAVAIDRFNSGHYAEGMITDRSAIEAEKLILDAFYLMQLRDYYELLERTALVLAVQVAMMVDEAPVPGTSGVVPVKKGE